MGELIRSTVLNGFEAIIREAGGDPRTYIAAAGIDPRLAADPDVYLPLRQLLDALNIAARQMNRTDIGLLLGQKQTIESLGPLSLAIGSAETARRAIEVFARFIHIHSPANTLALTPLPRTRLEFLSSTLSLRDPSGRTQNDERIISGLHTGMRLLAGDQYQPQAIWFMHAPISPLRTYRRVFGIVPEFNKSTTGIAIDRKALDAWRPNGSAELRKIAEKFLTQYAPPSEDSVVQHVAGMARSLLRAGDFTPQQAAHALGVHERTLQRRLREEGATFEQIKDKARKEWAEALLVQPSMPLTQIAGMLGYADSSAFSRSCRRWFGEAPKAYRIRLAGQPPTGRASRVNSLEANLRARRRADV